MFGSTRVTNPKLTIIFYFLFLSRELVYPGRISWGLSSVHSVGDIPILSNCTVSAKRYSVIILL